MLITELKSKPPFSELFDIDEKILNTITENMTRKGFDLSQPIVIWYDKRLVIDGHTRLKAAINAGLKEVAIYQTNFQSEEEALAYAIHNQRNRRNLTQAEILKCIEKVDQLKQQGKRTDLASSDAKLTPGKSAEHTAKIVGVSQATVERARTVLSDPEEKAVVLQGKKSISRASQEAKAKRQPPIPKPYAHSDANAFVSMAMINLERIRDDDPKRMEALQRMMLWIEGAGLPANFKPLPFTEAMKIATFVISNLARILPDDPMRKKAFKKVSTWVHHELNLERIGGK